MTKTTVTPSVSFIILNFNGKDLTERCIVSLLESFKKDSHEIIVVDNRSEDGSVGYLKERFPNIKMIEEPQNRFISAYNDGVEEARGDWAFLLNNDMTLETDFLDSILDHLDGEDTFAVGSKMLNEKGELEKGANVPEFRYGYVWVKTKEVEDISSSFYVGTHGIFNREKFLKLGGFDSLYSPFYSEDVDLCYRALKRGWKIYIQPRSVIYHQHMVTIKRHFKKSYVLRINARNHLIFHWKNLTSEKLFARHIAFLPLLLFGSIFKKKFYYIPAFFDALKYGDQIRQRRTRERQDQKVRDEDILSSFA
jgi:GT2 family glycosyltransferase